MPSRLLIREMLMTILLGFAWLALPAAAQESSPAPTDEQTLSAKSPSTALQESASTADALSTQAEKDGGQALATSVLAPEGHAAPAKAHAATDFMSMAFVFMLSTFIGVGVIRRVSRLLHTPLMSLTNAISAISVIGAIIVAGGEHYPTPIRVMGAIALFASMTNIISGFLITDRMLKMFKTDRRGKA